MEVLRNKLQKNEDDFNALVKTLEIADAEVVTLRNKLTKNEK